MLHRHPHTVISCVGTEHGSIDFEGLVARNTLYRTYPRSCHGLSAARCPQHISSSCSYSSGDHGPDPPKHLNFPKATLPMALPMAPGWSFLRIALDAFTFQAGGDLFPRAAGSTGCSEARSDEARCWKGVGAVNPCGICGVNQCKSDEIIFVFEFFWVWFCECSPNGSGREMFVQWGNGA
jgi:hypothetical protein